MAEAVFLELLKGRSDREDWKVDSCATDGWNAGGHADSRCLQTLKENGITDYRHTCREITQNDFQDFQYIVCMDQSNLNDLEDIKPSKCIAKVSLLGKYDDLNPTGVIRDPYYDRDTEGFKSVYRLSKSACESFFKKEGF